MKKFCFSLCMAMMAVAGWAQQVTVQQNKLDKEPQQTAFTESVEVASKAKKAPAEKAVTLADASTYAEFDYKQGATARTATGVVKLNKKSATEADLINLWAFADTLQATLDLEAGTIAIQPKQIYQHSTYGPIWICSVDFDKKAYSQKTPISGTFDEKGNINLGGWGVFITSGTYAGNTYGVYTSSELKATNATMTDVMLRYNSTAKDSIVSYPVYIEQTSDNEVSIMNFSNYGSEVKAQLSSDKSVTIAPQKLFSNAAYGDFICMPIDWTKQTSGQKANIQATATATNLSTGSWGAFCRLSTSTYARGTWSSNIAFADGTISFPTAKTLDWSGEGTAASPYVITNADQMLAFAESVNTGTSYQGKYVVLGNDIDMSGITSTYRPIGVSADKPFSGNFNGQGHSINNLTIDMGMESYAGTFGVADESSTISNLTISNVNLSTYGDFAGAVVGLSKGKLANLKVTGTVSQTGNYVGGIAGEFMGSSFTNGEFNGTVTGSGETAGIAGRLRGNSSGLVCHGSVSISSLLTTSYKGLGGIAGIISSVESVQGNLTDSYSDALLSDASGYAEVGGIAGEIFNANIKRCFSASPISSAAKVATSTTEAEGATGGIVGILWGGTMEDCYSGNTIVNTADSKKVGGIVGYVLSPMVSTNSGTGVKTYYYESKITRCMNYGQIRMPDVYTTQGVYGTTYADSIFVDCYYDQQISASTMGKMEKSTKELTNGNALANYSADTWNFTEGLYPRLKGLDTNDAAYLTASPLTITDGQNSRKVKTAFTVSSANNVKWYLYNSTTKALVTEDDALVMKNDTVSLKDKSATEVLVAIPGDNTSMMKMVYVETVNPSGFAGTGTEDDPYLIRNKEDLMTLNAAVSTNGQDFKGDFFKQTNDIDLDYATDFVGIGPSAASTASFAGTYDGQGYSIKKLAIDGVVYDANGTGTSKGSRSYAAFIGYLTADGTLKNLNIDADSRVTGWQGEAAFVGHNYGTVENCRNYATIQAIYQHSAGIVAMGEAGSKIVNCYNAGPITSNMSYAAGIVSYNKGGDVKYCQNDGTILVDSINSYKSGLRSYAAGIVVYNTGYGDIDGNINTGYIYALNDAGGITGNVTAATPNPIHNNINYGVVEYGNFASATYGGVIATSSDTSVENNYYDAQINCFGAAANAPAPGIKEALTRELTSGTALEGLDAEKYDWQAGQYPVLKAFKDEPAAVAHRQMVITLPDAETADDMASSGVLSQPEGLTWSLASAQQFGIDGNAVKVALGDATTSVRDTLTATLNGYTKRIALRAMPVQFKGAGTAEDPYLIETKDDMLRLASVTNNECYTFLNKHFKVVNDIDFGETPYETVAISPRLFNAEFDGNGKKMQNINYTGTLTSETYRALFGRLGANGSIHDLTLESGTIAPYSYGAGFAGSVYGKIYNCDNYATISTSRNMGAAGIAALVKDGGVISHCNNYGAITPSGIYGAGIACQTEYGSTIEYCTNYNDFVTTKADVGGIVSVCRGAIRHCTNKGNFSGASGIAGIVYTFNAYATIDSCYNEGNITSSSSKVAGIFVTSTATNDMEALVSNCVNTGNISGKGYVGGIGANTTNGVIVDGCVNRGTITSTGNYTGGLISHSKSDQNGVNEVRNSINYGDVTSTNGYCGGLTGYMITYPSFTNCVNYGDVKGGGYLVGGITGALSTGSLTKCYNAGNVTGLSSVGGLGGLDYGTNTLCFNLGDITATAEASRTNLGAAGGLAGYGYGKFLGAYNMGKVTSHAPLQVSTATPTRASNCLTPTTLAQWK